MDGEHLEERLLLWRLSVLGDSQCTNTVLDGVPVGTGGVLPGVPCTPVGVPCPLVLALTLLVVDDSSSHLQGCSCLVLRDIQDSTLGESLLVLVTQIHRRVKGTSLVLVDSLSNLLTNLVGRHLRTCHQRVIEFPKVGLGDLALSLKLSVSRVLTINLSWGDS